MIQSIDHSLLHLCSGGVGECCCSGTDTPLEKSCGSFRSLQNTPEECRDWCINVKHGTEWKFYDTHLLDVLGIFAKVTRGSAPSVVNARSFAS